MASSSLLESGIKTADGYVVDITTSALHNNSKRESVSDASTVVAGGGLYRDSFSDDEAFSPVGGRSERRGRTVLGRLFGGLMGTARRRKGLSGESSPDYFVASGEAFGLLKEERRRSRVSPPREVRRYRRGYVGGCIRRALVALPVVLLALLGVLHVAEFLLGRRDLLWDLGDYDEYLPDWGKLGHEGEGLAAYPTDATRDVIPIRCHSHNDYWRRVPLFDAIHWGCTGVEADVWLFDEELYVGHSTAALTKNRTFRTLYVDPLVNLLDQMNANSSFTNNNSNNATIRGVFDADPDQSLVLLVDFKTGGRDTFPFVHQQLSALRERNYLTYHDGETLHRRPITVVGTGNTPFNLVVTNSTHRDIFFDAPLDHLGEDVEEEEVEEELELTQQQQQTPNTSLSPQTTITPTNTSHHDQYNPTNSYYASVSFTHAIGFVWRGRLSATQLSTLRRQIRAAHRRGLKARYWDTPSWPVSLRNHVWRVLMREGADVLNVDDLRGAAVESWRERRREGDRGRVRVR